jgi:hypothetical protein
MRFSPRQQEGKEMAVYYWYFAGFAVFLVGWAFRWDILGLFQPSYEELVEEKNLLRECVIAWKYPDGRMVPQNHRQRMFRRLQKLSRLIRNHPDNPDNQFNQASD